MATDGKRVQQLLALLLLATTVSLCHARSPTPCDVIYEEAGPMVICHDISTFATITSYLEQVHAVPVHLFIKSTPELVFTKEDFQNPAFDNLQHFELEYHGITEFNPEVLTGLPKLRGLFIAFTNITTITSIDETTFAGLNLTGLGIYANNVTNIAEGTFRNLPHLTQLFLHVSNLTELPATLFRGLTNLNYLSLKGNYFASLDENIFLGLTNLTELILSNNNITSLNSKTFQPLIALTKLDLSHNQLESLESNTFESNTNLTKLDLSHNKLSNLENVNLTSSSLLELNIEGNGIEEYPPGFFQGMPNAENIHIS